MIEVTLTLDEVAMTGYVGQRRTIESKTNGFTDRYGARGKTLAELMLADIEAACAEKAVANAYNRPWDGSVNVGKRADVGGWQIRHTTRSDGCLIIRAKDPEAIYVLVTGTMPVYYIRGWIRASEARANDEWRRDPGGKEPAWFVPQHALHETTGRS